MFSEVSVVMAVYKEEEEQLRQAIESVLNQTYMKFEFIIILDNPNNNIAEGIIKGYCEFDNRVIFLKNDVNMGLPASLNKAIEKANGEYIVRMDADDICELHRIEEQFKYIKDNNVDVLGGGVDFINHDGETIQKFSKIISGSKKVEKIMQVTDIIYHPTWMMKKKVFNDLCGYRNIHAAEDYDFLLRALKKGYKLDNINSKVLKYRLSINSISRDNAFKQYLTSEFMKNNYKNNFEISDLNNYLQINFTQVNIERYKNGNEYLTQLRLAYNNKEVIKIVKNLILILFSSKYIIKNLFRILKYKLLCIVYR